MLQHHLRHSSDSMYTTVNLIRFNIFTGICESQINQNLCFLFMSLQLFSDTAHIFMVNVFTVEFEIRELGKCFFAVYLLSLLGQP